MGNLRLWKEPFWNEPIFNDVLDLFYETPSFIDKSFKKSNIVTNEQDYRIQVAVPGLTKEDVKIAVNNSVITITHEKKETDEETFYFTSSFKKQYTLPEDCNVDKITSTMENGVLEVTIPRTKKKVTERYIEIK